LGIRDGGELYYYIGTGSGGVSSAWTATAGNWYYICLTFSGSTFRIYINNTQVLTGSASPGATGTTFYGAGVNNNHRYHAKISEWQVYEKELQVSELTTNWDIGRERYGL